MAAYVLERERWGARNDLIPKSKVLDTEAKVKRWLEKPNDWRWYLEDDEARARLEKLATGICDVRKRKLPSMPNINIGDEVLLIRRGPEGPEGPEWQYEIAYLSTLRDIVGD